MLNQVKMLAREYDMLPEGGHILCAVSGGPDSVCLLRLLLDLSGPGGFRVSAAHFDHCLRGEESAGDAAFTQELCAAWGVPCRIGRGDVAAEAARTGRGVEETARRMRYRFLEETARELNCDRVATAHNANDNAETLLLHLTRGSGLQGLTGILPRRGGVVRPLLTCTREEIEGFLRERDIPSRQDSSNADQRYSRNRIRAQVIPVLQQLNPRFLENTAETVRALRADNDYLNAQARRVCNAARRDGEDLVIEAAAIAYQPAAVAVRVARRLLSLLQGGDTDCTAAHLNAIVELARGEDPSAQISLPGGWMAVREYKDLRFLLPDRLPSTFEPVPVDPDHPAEVPGWRLSCRRAVCPEEPELRWDVFWLAVDRCAGPLLLRPRQTGDSLTLPWRQGSRTLKKLFIEARIPRLERCGIPVLADETGVLAVAGFGPQKDRLARPGEDALELRLIPTQKE